MTSFTITIQDAGVRDALKALSARVNNMQPVLESIGADIVERTQHRFDVSTGPDGVKWKPNTAATLDMLAATLGKSYRKKSGDLNNKGNVRIANKKPLIGESKHLLNSFHAKATPKDLTVSSSMAYAAIQQFGGTTGAKSWTHGATIPARPFLPVLLGTGPDGSLYPQEQALIVQAINDYLADGL